jgi:hypothetical protein
MMATPETVGGDKNLSLADLNKLVAQQEDQLGPLTGIGNDGTQTLLTFDMDQDPPAKHAIIATGTSPVPAGSAKVCAGKVFVAGTLTDAVAARPG